MGSMLSDTLRPCELHTSAGFMAEIQGARRTKAFRRAVNPLGLMATMAVAFRKSWYTF